MPIELEFIMCLNILNALEVASDIAGFLYGGQRKCVI